MTTSQVIADNLNRIRGRIADACARVGRSQQSVKLVAVTKYAEMEWVRQLVELGHLDLGESRPQQLSERTVLLPGTICWHMIGHLQRNKVRAVLESNAVIHSVDSRKLLERINRLAEDMGLTAEVFLEVNISREEAKHGLAPERVFEILPILGACQHVKALGLMGMAPYADDPEAARPYFQELREIQESLNRELSIEDQLCQLSMGMSGDFEVGIEEGATHIRIGSALFEGLSSD